jgi:hypothetical protein
MLVFSTVPQPGELRLPGETAEALRAAPQPTLANHWYRGPLDAEQEQRQSEMREQWAAATGYRVVVSDTSPAGTGLAICASAFPIRSDVREGTRWSGYPRGGGTSFHIGTYPFDYRRKSDPDDTPKQRALLDKDPVLGVRKPFRPEAKPNTYPTATQEWDRTLLVDLARTYGVNLIADAYWGSRPFRPDLGRVLASGEPAALYTLLDRHFYRCDRSGNLVRLRSRQWFLERPREIPLRLVRGWQASWDRKGGLSLDEYAEIARGLTEAQTTKLPTVIREASLPSDLGAVPPARRALQLYGALTAAQREALWRGGAVPIAQMTPAQRELFAAAVQERTPWLAPAVLGQRTTGTLSLTTQPLLRTQVKRGGVVTRETTERLPPTGGAEPTGGGAGLVTVPPPTATPAVGSARGASRPDAPGSAHDAPREEVKRWPVTDVSFVFRYDSGIQDILHLIAAPTP